LYKQDVTKGHLGQITNDVAFSHTDFRDPHLSFQALIYDIDKKLGDYLKDVLAIIKMPVSKSSILELLKPIAGGYYLP